MERKPTEQIKFLTQLKESLPSTVAFVDQLAEVLSISKDSAYRRIRGETILSLNEVKSLVAYYKIPLSTLLSGMGESVNFQYQAVDGEKFTFENWICSLVEKLEIINSYPSPNKELIYYAKDVPIFYYFQFPELGAFKMFFWMKSILRYPTFTNHKFDVSEISTTLREAAVKSNEIYLKLPSSEIWSDETFNVTVKQILYYVECGFFKDSETALTIANQYINLINQMREFCEKGVKSGGGSFAIFKNELLVGENTVHFKMGSTRMTIVSHNITDTLSSTDSEFCLRTEKFLTNLINNAPMISGHSQRERDKFFNQTIEKVEKLKSRIQLTNQLESD